MTETTDDQILARFAQRRGSFERGQKMDEKKRRSNAKNTDGETAAERLCDREGLRILSLIQRIIFEKMRRADTNHLETIRADYARRAALCDLDQTVTIAGEILTRAAQKHSAAAADVLPG